MSILFTIAHFFDARGGKRHGSLSPDPRPRIQALAACVTALHQLFGKSQYVVDIVRRAAVPLGQPPCREIKVVICTTKERHLLARLALPSHFYTHHPTNAEPLLLGFECRSVLKDTLGKYDYYCYLEDDLILHDPLFFVKLAWFTQMTGNRNLLQPNRYEAAQSRLARKVYIDGNLAPRVTAPFQNVQEQPELTGHVMKTPIVFRRPLNPHSGCYFLNAKQMAYWVQHPTFWDHDTSFVGPLESAATLGIMQAFRVYKPALQNVGFLEIQHFGTSFLNVVKGKIQPGDGVTGAPRQRKS